MGAPQLILSIPDSSIHRDALRPYRPSTHSLHSTPPEPLQADHLGPAETYDKGSPMSDFTPRRNSCLSDNDGQRGLVTERSPVGQVGRLCLLSSIRSSSLERKSPSRSPRSSRVCFAHGSSVIGACILLVRAGTVNELGQSGVSSAPAILPFGLR